jgi:methionyl-tRNA formyltransferase
LNVHTSLLPKYRGASPIQTAMLHGEPETGVTIMKMEAGLDTGPILTTESTPIRQEDDAQTLHDRLAQLGAQLLVHTIPDYAAGKIHPHPQPVTGVSHAAKIKKEDGRIDWSQSATDIWNRVRAFTPWPGAFTHIGDPAMLLKIWQVEPLQESGKFGEILRADKNGIVVGCGTGAVRILTLQRQGGKRLAAHEFLTGCPLKHGDLFH